MSMSKYDALKRYLRQHTERELPMTFAEIERIIGQPLPASARRHRAWWSNNPANNVMTRAWLEAGYRAARVDLSAGRLVFVRATDASIAPGGEAKQHEKSDVSQETAPPLHGFLKGMLRLPPEEELLRPAPAQWEAQDSPLPEHCPDAC